MTVEVHLRPGDVYHAAHVGMLRNATALARDRDRGPASVDAWSAHIEGAGAELAVAMYLGAYWWAAIDRPGAPDVGGDVEVRQTARVDGRLVIRPKDNPRRAYFLVTGTLPDFKIVGWIEGADGMVDLNYRGDDRWPAWWIDQRLLNPPDTYQPVSAGAAPGFQSPDAARDA